MTGSVKVLSAHGFRRPEITTEQFRGNCALVVAAVSGPKRFVGFVIRSGMRMTWFGVRRIPLWSHASHCERRHAIKMRFERNNRYCAGVRFCAHSYEVMCAPSFGRCCSKTMSFVRRVCVLRSLRPHAEKSVTQNRLTLGKSVKPFACTKWLAPKARFIPSDSRAKNRFF